MRFDRRSTPIRLQFDRATTIRRPTLRPLWHYGDRAFGVAGPRLWNALPISLRQPHLSLGQFRRALKRIYLTVSAGRSDFLFLDPDYK